MAGVALDDADGTAYIVGLVVLVLSILAYFARPHWAFVVSGIAGFGIFYANAFDDLFDAADLDGDNPGMVISLGLLVFTFLVTGVTWFLPERVVGGVVAGVIAAVGHLLLLAGLAIGMFFQSTFVTYSGSYDDGDGGSGPTRIDTFDNDVWVILVVALVLAAAWAWLGRQTGQVGFRLLIVGISVTVIPLATVVLAVEHPSWWGAVVGVLGAATLGGLLVGRRSMSVPPAGPRYSS